MEATALADLGPDFGIEFLSGQRLGVLCGVVPDFASALPLSSADSFSSRFSTLVRRLSSSDSPAASTSVKRIRAEHCHPNAWPPVPTRTG